MPEIKIETTIKTSRKHGPGFCDYECPHIETYTRFPPVAICKLSGTMIHTDSLERVARTVFCKYLCDEEVPERFWSPLKTT